PIANRQVERRLMKLRCDSSQQDVTVTAVQDHKRRPQDAGHAAHQREIDEEDVTRSVDHRRCYPSLRSPWRIAPSQTLPKAGPRPQAIERLPSLQQPDPPAWRWQRAIECNRPGRV